MGYRINSILLTLLVVGYNQGALSEEWPTTEFDVVVVDYQLQQQSPFLFGPLQAALASFGIEINGTPNLHLPVETRTEIETFLHDSAEILERWGFPPPLLRAPWQTQGAYRVFIVETLGDSAGEYHARSSRTPLCDQLVDPFIFVAADDLLSNGLLTDRGRSTVAHELFHAVQYSMPFFDTPCEAGAPGDWITEGTARAVGWDLVRLLRSLEQYGELEPWGGRDYSAPLPVPLRHDRLSEDQAALTPSPYPTASFWRYLAESYAAGGLLSTPPGPAATTPFDYGFLARMFASAPPARDCYTPQAECLSELRWLDRQIKETLGAPLHDLYTRFVGTAVLYADERVNGRAVGATSSKDWREKLFDYGCLPLPRCALDADNSGASYSRTGCRLTPELTEVEESAFIFPTAANCFMVSLGDFGHDVNLVVRARGTEEYGRWTVSDLSAIVARPDGAANMELVSEPQRVQPRTDSATGDPAVEWWFGLPENDVSYLLLTNVADDPADTQPLSVTLSFRALHEYVSMGVSDERAESEGVVEGPTAADIARPIDLDMVEGNLTVFYVAPDDFSELDLGEPVCTFSLRLRSGNDALWVAGNLPVPIRPGNYPIVSAPDGAPGFLGSRLGTNRAGTRGRLELAGKSGHLEIEAVDHLLVEGSVVTHLMKGLEGGDVHLAVRAEFGIHPDSGISGFLGPKASDHPCFSDR